ncbi:glycoside hydrolase family 3 protein [Penicillium antarcticum]|uniref:glycoside hydrolase family 3 protein n=1 Tax=Penicillium antarcticum TaxID=416450 RepID=UPI00239FDE14|nr:glycoside hydrolase family 3 protein [Penicillium antarcticum]KAJ5295906.1 glycoside hydrolase family 3 protein [Penicillium antarcticum]
MPKQTGNPTKLLRGFVAIPICDGVTQTRKIYLTRKDISYWDVMTQTWVTPNGTIFRSRCPDGHFGQKSSRREICATYYK